MPSKKLFVAFGALLLTVSLQVSAKDNIYKLAFHISQGKTEASPTIVVKEGSPGTIEVTGATGYSLAATATDAGPGKIKVSLTYKSASSSSAPILIVRDGHEASLTQGETEIKLTATRSGN